MATHNDQLNLAQIVASTLTRGDQLDFLTDAIVNAATTRAGLIAAINAVPAHNDQTNLKIAIARAINFDPNITDAAVSSATTVAGLIALTGITNSTGATILE